MSRTCLISLAVLALAVPAWAADTKAETARPFNGKNLKGWKFKGGPEARARSLWVVGEVSVDPKSPNKLVVVPAADTADNALVNSGRGVDLYTEGEWGDCTIELEFMVPKDSNSGIYVMGEYEVQILDSYGKDKIGPGDVGAIYGASVPKVNAAKKPGAWQKFVIDFRAPRFKDGKKVANARFVKVTLNGKVLQENVEVKGPTPSCLTGKEKPKGPLMFQGDHGPVAFRNIRITPR
jgi:hypothetical protein